MVMVGAALVISASLAGCNREVAQAPVPTVIAAQAAPEARVISSEMVATTEGFVKEAATSDLYEIDSSNIILQRSNSAPVKKFAQQMIDAHSRTRNALKLLVTMAKIDVALPTGLDERRIEMIESLNGASDAELDSRYLDQQARAHREAAMLFRGYAQNGDNDDIKRAAAATLPMIERHFEMVESLDKSGAHTLAIEGPLAPPRY
jgi:putative membrane protein